MVWKEFFSWKASSVKHICKHSALLHTREFHLWMLHLGVKCRDEAGYSQHLFIEECIKYYKLCHVWPKPHDPNTKLFTWAHANSRSKTNSLKTNIIEHKSTIRKHDNESCVISRFMQHKHDTLSLRLLDINQTYCHTWKENAIEGEKPFVYSLCIL